MVYIRSSRDHPFSMYAIFDSLPPPGTQYDVIVTIKWSLLRTKWSTPLPRLCTYTKWMVPKQNFNKSRRKELRTAKKRGKFCPKISRYWSVSKFSTKLNKKK